MADVTDSTADSTGAVAEEQEILLLDSIERFLEKEVAPYAHDLEQEDAYPEDIVEGMKLSLIHI